MSKRTGVLLFLLLVSFFLVINRGAYRGYFQTDEADNIGWTRLVWKIDYLKALVSPRFQPNNFRPVGHFYFREASNYFGLDFWKYVAVIHLFHILNVWLIWVLARRLRAPPSAAGAACVLFAFHMALFDDFWKPMYVFDVLCATFCLLSMVWYTQRRWVLSFVAFWLAYRSKELAVMLPAALACYEIWFGKRNWKPLVPFFLASLSFGLQGIFLNPNKNNDYSFRFTAAALAKTSFFYGSRVFLLPFAGLLLPLAAIFSRNRRTWFGMAAMAIFFFPLLFLPGRLYSAYCYVPFIGLAIALSGFAESAGRIPLAVFFLVFIPLDAYSFATQQKVTLDLDEGAHRWFNTVAQFARTKPDVDTLVFAGNPIGYGRTGIESGIKFIFHNDALHVYYIDDAESKTALQREKMALLTWDYEARRLDIVEHKSNMPDASFIVVDGAARVWQLEQGWYDQEGDHRWIAPQATARLTRPPGAAGFQVRVKIYQGVLDAVGPLTLRITLADTTGDTTGEAALEPRRFSSGGWQTATWPLAPAAAGPVRIVFQSSPPYQPPDDKSLRSIAVGAFGFVSAADRPLADRPQPAKRLRASR